VGGGDIEPQFPASIHDRGEFQSHIDHNVAQLRPEGRTILPVAHLEATDRRSPGNGQAAELGVRVLAGAGVGRKPLLPQDALQPAMEKGQLGHHDDHRLAHPGGILSLRDESVGVVHVPRLAQERHRRGAALHLATREAAASDPTSEKTGEKATNILAHDLSHVALSPGVAKDLRIQENVLMTFLPGSLPRHAFAWTVGLGLLLAPVSRAEQPNFIVILTDNLGYGDTGPFGNTVHRTPHLDRMATEGRMFTHFYASAGVCTPSRASLMTGCYAQRVALHQTPRDLHVLRPVSPYGLHPEEVTVAETLRSLGYATAMIGKWHLGDQPEFLPTRQGFDRYFGIPYSDDMTERTWDRDGSSWPPLPLMEHETVVEAPVDRENLTARYTERALSWISELQNRPFFLFLSHAMPGSTPHPFASESFRGRSRNGPWGDAVEELDHSTGRILDHLRTLGLDRRTCVVWTSDNGAPLARQTGDASRGSNAPLPGRGYTTDEGGFRIPMIAWWPGTIPAGTRCEELATTMDLLPTLSHLAGGVPGDRKIDGHDIRRLLVGEPEAETPYLAFAYYDRDQLQAVRSGPWKLFLPVADFERHPRFQKGTSAAPLLFHLEEDVSGLRDVAPSHPEVVKRLTDLAEGFRAELGDRDRLGSGTRPVGMVDQATPRVLGHAKPGNLR